MQEIIGVLIGGLISVVSIWASNRLSNRSSWQKKRFEILVEIYADIFSCYRLSEHGSNRDVIKQLAVKIEKASLFVSDQSYNTLQRFYIAVLAGPDNEVEQIDLEVQLRNLAKEDMRNCQR